jgi:hypothetical protein
MKIDIGQMTGVLRSVSLKDFKWNNFDTDYCQTIRSHLCWSSEVLWNLAFILWSLYTCIASHRTFIEFHMMGESREYTLWSQGHEYESTERNYQQRVRALAIVCFLLACAPLIETRVIVSLHSSTHSTVACKITASECTTSWN